MMKGAVSSHKKRGWGNKKPGGVAEKMKDETRP